MAMQVASLDGDEITELPPPLLTVQLKRYNRKQCATATLTTTSARRYRGQHDGGQVLDGIGLVLDGIDIVLEGIGLMLEGIVLVLSSAAPLFAFVTMVLVTHGYMYLIGISVVVFLYLGVQALWNFCRMCGDGTRAASLDFMRDQVPWSDLQPELLGLVLGSLPSLADRVRLRAVCSPWRSNSLLQSVPLPFPWLSLPDGTFLSIPGGEIHQMPVPVGDLCHGSIDNWLFLVSSDGVCSLMNPFSKIKLELQLPDLVTIWQLEIPIGCHSYPIQPVYKLVAPSPLDSSPDCPVAVLVMEDGDWITPRTLCISQPHIVTCSFNGYDEPLLHLLDVAFLEGKLYAVCWSDKLFIFELDKDLAHDPNIECIIDTWGDECVLPEWLTTQYTIRNYLVECGGVVDC